MIVKCDECSKDSIYILQSKACDCPSVNLCVDHAAKMSDGSAGYTKLTIKKIVFNSCPHSYKPSAISFTSPVDACYICLRKITDKNNEEFYKQQINPEYDMPIGLFGRDVYQARPVDKFSYWVCKDGDSCI